MPNVLPAQHRYAHDYAIFLHDLIVGKLKSALDANLFHVEFDTTPEEARALRQLSGTSLYNWIEHNKDSVILAEMDYKEIFRAVLSDFCHFVLEGLRASKKGKLTVAYALFRKPFRDNLFYREWLLADPTDLLTRFHTSPEAIDVGGLSKIVGFRERVIANAVERSGSAGMDPKFIYQIRYDRSGPFGLAVTWDQAIHLVTTWNRSRTETGNLNFVFSGPSEWDSQWEGLYLLLPYLLYHAVHVVDTLFASFAEVDEGYSAMKAVRRDIGFALLAAARDRKPGHRNLGETLMRDLEAVGLSCPNCSVPFRLHRRNLRMFSVGGSLRCSSCRISAIVDDTDGPRAQGSGLGTRSKRGHLERVRFASSEAAKPG